MQMMCFVIAGPNQVIEIESEIENHKYVQKHVTLVGITCKEKLAIKTYFNNQTQIVRKMQLTS